MGRQSGWWDDTSNMVGGCSICRPGCTSCYAMLLAGTQQAVHKIALYDGVTDKINGKHVFNGKLTVLAPDHPGWTWPLTWPGAKHPVMGPGQPSLIFVSDMADLFHEQRSVGHIDKVIAALLPSRHISLLLTRRPARMAAYFAAQPKSVRQRGQKKLWLGFSAERQKEFDAMWPHMRPLAEAGWTVYVAIAPMLRPVKLPDNFTAQERIWVICSGEQGKGARPMDPAWARALRDQCADAGVQFFMNQMSGRKQIPADLFVRQFPPHWRG